MSTTTDNVQHVHVLPNGQVLNIRVIGHAKPFKPSDVPPQKDAVATSQYDTIIVGGGLSGMTAATYLQNYNQKRLLILEQRSHPGGIASRGVAPPRNPRAEGKEEGEGNVVLPRTTYARGAAYYTKPEGGVAKAYHELNLTAIKKTAIVSPIDNYVFKGRLVRDVWEKQNMSLFPSGFARFRHKLLKMKRGCLSDFDVPEDVPNLPKKQRRTLELLDTKTAAQFLKKYGPELSQFLDSYSQSALGGHLTQVSALAFLQFYMDEMETRYAWKGGTAGATSILGRRLRRKQRHIFSTHSTVHQVQHDATRQRVKVAYSQNGKWRQAEAANVIMACTLPVACHLFSELQNDAERSQAIASLKFADYIVHVVFTSKELYTEGFDTWFSDKCFSDVIVSRWVQTHGFFGTNHKQDRAGGMLTIYQPLAPSSDAHATFDSSTVANLAAECIMDLTKFLPALSHEKQLTIESCRWPASIHLLHPGYLTGPATTLSKPIGRVHFANNNLGFPSFETSILSGRRAAYEILGATRRPLTPAL